MKMRDLVGEMGIDTYLFNLEVLLANCPVGSRTQVKGE